MEFLNELFEVTNCPTKDPIMEEIGYQPKTSFWMDFSIADAFGVSAVEDTYNRAFNEWKNNVEYITELVIVLNHKLWQHYERSNDELGVLYNRLWEEADDWCMDNLKDDDLKYFLEVTD